MCLIKHQNILQILALKSISYYLQKKIHFTIIIHYCTKTNYASPPPPFTLACYTTNGPWKFSDFSVETNILSNKNKYKSLGLKPYVLDRFTIQSLYLRSHTLRMSFLSKKQSLYNRFKYSFVLQCFVLK